MYVHHRPPLLSSLPPPVSILRDNDAGVWFGEGIGGNMKKFPRHLHRKDWGVEYDSWKQKPITINRPLQKTLDRTSRNPFVRRASLDDADGATQAGRSASASPIRRRKSTLRGGEDDSKAGGPRTEKALYITSPPRQVVDPGSTEVPATLPRRRVVMGNVIRVKRRRRAQSLTMEGGAVKPDLRALVAATLKEKTGNAIVGAINAEVDEVTSPVKQRVASPERRASIPEELLSPKRRAAQQQPRQQPQSGGAVDEALAAAALSPAVVHGADDGGERVADDEGDGQVVSAVPFALPVDADDARATATPTAGADSDGPARRGSGQSTAAAAAPVASRRVSMAASVKSSASGDQARASTSRRSTAVDVVKGSAVAPSSARGSARTGRASSVDSGVARSDVQDDSGAGVSERKGDDGDGPSSADAVTASAAGGSGAAGSGGAAGSDGSGTPSGPPGRRDSTASSAERRDSAGSVDRKPVKRTSALSRQSGDATSVVSAVVPRRSVVSSVADDDGDSSSSEKEAAAEFMTQTSDDMEVMTQCGAAVCDGVRLW